MTVIHKTTFRPVLLSPAEGESENAIVTAREKAMIDAMLEETVDLLREETDERGRQMNALQAKIASLEGRINDLMLTLLRGQGQVVELPPLPKIEASTARTIVRKVTLKP